MLLLEGFRVPSLLTTRQRDLQLILALAQLASVACVVASAGLGVSSGYRHHERATQYRPSQTAPDAPFSVSNATMAAAVDCPKGLTGKQIVILVHGIGASGSSDPCHPARSPRADTRLRPPQERLSGPRARWECFCPRLVRDTMFAGSASHLLLKCTEY